MAGEGSSFWGLNYCAIGHRRNQISLIKEQFGVHIFGLALLSYSESDRYMCIASIGSHYLHSSGGLFKFSWCLKLLFLSEPKKALFG